MPPPSSPFGTEPIAEIPLPQTPLIRVVAQVRFPPILSIKAPEFVAPIQAALREMYPILRPEKEVGFVISPQGVAAQPGEGVVWRFHDRPDKWRVSLAPEFLALDTSSYTSRTEFFDRFAQALSAVEQHAKPAIYDRVGVRYIDRLKGPDVAEIAKLVRSELIGLSALAGRDRATLTHGIQEHNFQIDDARLHVRSAFLPENATLDPSIQPVDERSWLLDLDMFTNTSNDFRATEVVALARSYAAQIYRFFRWSVTDDLLRKCGGRP